MTNNNTNFHDDLHVRCLVIVSNHARTYSYLIHLIENDLNITVHEWHDGVRPGNCLFNSLFNMTRKKDWSTRYWPFMRGIHRSSVDSPHWGPVVWMRFHVMTSSWKLHNSPKYLSFVGCQRYRSCGIHSRHPERQQGRVKIRTVLTHSDWLVEQFSKVRKTKYMQILNGLCLLPMIVIQNHP